MADAYNVANNIPYQLFLLVGGGTVGAILVPGLVAQRARSRNHFNEYATLVLIATACLAAASTAIFLWQAPNLIKHFGGDAWSSDQFDLTLYFAYWCLPQVGLYALITIATQILTAGERIIATTLAPMCASISVMAAATLFALWSSGSLSPAEVPDHARLVLGLGTLTGVALQLGMLLLAMHKTGYRAKFPKTLRHWGIRNASGGAGLAFLTTAIYQIVALYVTSASSRAGADAIRLGFDGRGYSVYFYAQSLVLTAEAVVVAAIAQLLLARLSHLWTSQNVTAAAITLRDAFERIVSLILPLSVVVSASGPLLAACLVPSASSSEATRYLGVCIAAMAGGLLPFAHQSVAARALYANRDALTPLRSAVMIAAVWATGIYVSSQLLPSRWVVFGICVAFSLAYSVDVVLKNRRLRDVYQDKNLLPSKLYYLRLMLVSLLCAAPAIVGSSLVLTGVITDRFVALGVLLGAATFFAAMLATSTRKWRVGPWSVTRSALGRGSS